MFPRTVLKVVPSGEERYYLTTFNTGVFTLKLRLPPDTWCDQCILQWTYTVTFLIIDPSQCTHNGHIPHHQPSLIFPFVQPTWSYLPVMDLPHVFMFHHFSVWRICGILMTI